MSGIDDLAHDAEVEAEVLRAVTHMTPARAQEFLIGLVLKIKRAATPVRKGVVTLPKVLASSIAPEPEASTSGPVGEIRPTGTRTAEIIAHIRRVGRATSSEVSDALGLHGGDRASACATLSSLRRRGFLRKDGDHFSLATLEPELPAAVNE